MNKMWQCCLTNPPAINQLIMVRNKKDFMSDMYRMYIAQESLTQANVSYTCHIGSFMFELNESLDDYEWIEIDSLK